MLAWYGRFLRGAADACLVRPILAGAADSRPFGTNDSCFQADIRSTRHQPRGIGQAFAVTTQASAVTPFEPGKGRPEQGSAARTDKDRPLVPNKERQLVPDKDRQLVPDKDRQLVPNENRLT
jgi:hypothetical protein